jgi:metal-responsive CopG/Arc/MetJ family transcriptional regulator
MSIEFVKISLFFVDGEVMQIIERIETTVSLPKDLLEQAHQINKDDPISEVIEMALRDYVAKENGRELNRRDIEIINANADLINKQVEDTLQFQAEW